MTERAPAFAAEVGETGFQAGDILVRGRALAVVPDVSSGVDTIGGNVAITNTYVPEVDVTYFLTPNIGIEGIAATTRHGVDDLHSTSGDLSLGTVRLLPPTVTAQWHFLPKSSFNPYVGAGINYTVFYNATHASELSDIKYSNNFGYAFQAGADYNISDRWYINVDVKKILLHTTVDMHTTGGTPIHANVDIDPWLVGTGIGYRF